jgi:putative membrane protein
MAGSLYALWPFKKVMVMAQQYVKQDGVIIIIENAQIYTNINILPNTHQFLTSLAFFIAGCAVMMVFIRVES